jgi:hypothetical protein
MCPLGMIMGTLVTEAWLCSALRASITSRSSLSRSAKCLLVESSAPISSQRWLPSTMVMVPMSRPQSWNGMNAVSMSSDVHDCQ